jgi:hypothetical protein
VPRGARRLAERSVRDSNLRPSTRRDAAPLGNAKEARWRAGRSDPFASRASSTS